MKLSERFVKGAGMQLVKWVLGLLFVAAAGYYVAERLFNTTDKDIAQIRATADSAIRASEAKDTTLARLRGERNALRDSAQADSLAMVGLRRQRNRLTVTARTLRRDLSNAATQIDTIRLYIKTIQVQDSTIAVCGLEVETCLQRTRRLTEVIRTDSTTIGILRSDRDSLRRITGDLVAATNDCKNGQANLVLFRFCKPNPVVTFLVGTVVGGTVACIATHCLSDNPQVVVVQPTDNPEFVK